MALSSETNACIVAGAAGEFGDGVGRGLEAEVLAVGGEVAFDDGVGEEGVLLFEGSDVDVILLFGGHAHGVAEHAADISDVVLAEGEGLGEGGVREDGMIVPLLVLFQEFGGFVQMRETRVR